MYGIVESMYIWMELDINVVVEVEVETPVGRYVMERTSAMNLRATSWYMGNVTFFELNLEASYPPSVKLPWTLSYPASIRFCNQDLKVLLTI
jgi:hypothetical protein